MLKRAINGFKASEEWDDLENDATIYFPLSFQHPFHNGLSRFFRRDDREIPLNNGKALYILYCSLFSLDIPMIKI